MIKGKNIAVLISILLLLFLASCGDDDDPVGPVDESCGAGLQDDDGDGTCAAICAEAPWWSNDYDHRVAFAVTNSDQNPATSGSPARVVFDHATWVSDARSLANGNDVRVLFWDGTSHTELGRALVTAWNDVATEIFFVLAQDLDAGATDAGYWLYFGNEDAAAPIAYERPITSSWAAYAPTDPDISLDCGERHGSFYSLQLRQLAPSSYVIHIYDRTYDSDAYATIRITGAQSGVLFEKTYGSIGNYDNPATADEPLEIPDSEFTVFIESMEFSASSRYFGCTRYYTGNPPTDQVGNNEISFVVPNLPAGELCGM